MVRVRPGETQRPRRVAVLRTTTSEAAHAAVVRQLVWPASGWYSPAGGLHAMQARRSEVSLGGVVCECVSV